MLPGERKASARKAAQSRWRKASRKERTAAAGKAVRARWAKEHESVGSRRLALSGRIA